MKSVIVSFALLVCGGIALSEDAPRPQAKDPKLRDELLERVKKDQDARQELIEWMKANGTNAGGGPIKLDKEKKAEWDKVVARLKTIDEGNTKWLKEVVEQSGWPTKSLVGADGANAAWLLVQHADADPKFQRHCLDLMNKLPKDEVSQSNLAYLTDRVLLAEGKKQIYGTQFMSEDGKWKPRPLEDEANVDKRRAEVGLPPLAEYVKQLEQQYGGKPKK